MKGFAQRCGLPAFMLHCPSWSQIICLSQHNKEPYHYFVDSLGPFFFCFYWFASVNCMMSPVLGLILSRRAKLNINANGLLNGKVKYGAEGQIVLILYSGNWFMKLQSQGEIISSLLFFSSVHASYFPDCRTSQPIFQKCSYTSWPMLLFRWKF